MNPALLSEIIVKNGTDVKAIFDILGIDKVMQIAPHLMNIAATLQAAQPKT